MSLEDVQVILQEFSTVIRFLIAVLGIVATLLPFIQRLDDLLPSFIARFLSSIFQLVGLYASKICITSSISPDDPSALVSGLVNTGNSCFLNSVLQALSSLPYLHEHLQALNNSSTATALPVTRSLLKILRRLTQPLYRHSSFRPTEIATALSSNRRITSREQQDAQEFFQLVSSALDTEGQQGAIRHFTFNNIQLNLPTKYTATLDECLSRFTAMEYLDDASCRLCSLQATLQTIKEEIQCSKKDKRKKLEMNKKRIEQAIQANRIEDEEIECIRASGGVSSKQVMIAKPPRILCLHVSRSAYMNTGMVYKNPCRLIFPEYLDVAPYTTGGHLNTIDPRLPISTGRSARVLYKLMSVVVHYGSHSFGHFVAYKRRIYTDQCGCNKCQKKENYRSQEDWYRISDTKVDRCDLENVLSSNPYMLIYEMVEEAHYDTSLETEDEQQQEERDVSSLYSAMDEASKAALSIANALLAQDEEISIMK
ncbi:hypothetical protein G6F22_010298 [Rhizopus arrhizus]|nr:hypothetical protein G6F22_010298 [Rhizopus arrhizus]